MAKTTPSPENAGPIPSDNEIRFEELNAKLDRPPVPADTVSIQPQRRRLPDTRQSITHKFSIAGHEGYLTIGLYEDATPGELFITMAKEGSTIGGLMDTIGVLTSLALQYGVSVGSLARKFQHTRFEPSGFTNNPEIPVASSIADYVFRWMGMRFCDEFRQERLRIGEADED
jgi:ribonucleoside-diphosphate reductase alpha chain